jgi:CubicO group peptidase (beta-lactamase class C family)
MPFPRRFSAFALPGPVSTIAGTIGALVLIAAPLASQAATLRVGSTLGAADRHAIDALFTAYDKPHVPGCALGVFRNGAIAYGRGYGWADLERDVPITTSSLFDIGSTSKQFAAASIALLVAEHKLAYTDDVHKYIPELPDYGGAGPPITINDLMHHTSGLRDYTGLLELAGHSLEEASTDSQALAGIVRQRNLNFPTGSKFEYSNTGYFLLSVIVQRVSGKSLADFAREHIFLPLGMTHTRYRNHAAMLIPNRALGYAPDDSGGFRNSMSNWEQTGDGAVQLSIRDALAWDENYYHPKVGGPEMVRAMQTRGTLANGDSTGYGRGLFIDHYRGLNRIQHGGDWVGYHAAYSRFPAQHTSVLIMCNSDGISPSEIADGVSDIVLAKSFPEKSPRMAASGAKSSGAKASDTRATVSLSSSLASSRADSARFSGSFYAPSTNEVARISRNDSALVLEIVGRSLPLVHTAPNSFSVAGLPVTVEFLGDTGVPARAMRVNVGGDLRFEATRFTPATPNAAALRELAGSYYSSELDVTWPMVLRGDTLLLNNGASAQSGITGALEPALPDAFAAGGGYVHFSRDSSGKITGYELSASRMRNIHFERQASAP